MTFEQKKSPGHCPDGQQKDVAEQLCPSSSVYSLAAGYPASAITFYGEPAEFGKNRTLRFSGHP